MIAGVPAGGQFAGKTHPEGALGRPLIRVCKILNVNWDWEPK